MKTKCPAPGGLIHDKVLPRYDSFLSELLCPSTAALLSTLFSCRFVLCRIVLTLMRHLGGEKKNVFIKSTTKQKRKTFDLTLAQPYLSCVLSLLLSTVAASWVGVPSYSL